MSQTIQRVRTVLTGPKISGILDILSYTQEPIRFESLRLKSRIKYKRSYINYLKYCTDKNLVTNWKKRLDYKEGNHQSWFLITDEGRLLLEMLA